MTQIVADIDFTGDLFSAGRADSEINRAVEVNLTRAGLFLQGEVQRNTEVYTSKLRRSWVSRYVKAQNQVFVSNLAEYALAVELGRKAAPVPIEPLTLWVRRKLGVSDPVQARSVAFAISKKKARQRTPGTFFARDTFEKNIPKLNREFLEPIGAQIVENLSQ